MMLRFLTKAMDKKVSKKEKIVGYTLIGKSTTVVGSISSKNEDLRIEGSIFGEITTKLNVFVSKKASTDGTLLGNKIINFGSIKGKINARNLELKSISKTFGDLKTKQLVVDEGAFFEGIIEMSD